MGRLKYQGNIKFSKQSVLAWSASLVIVVATIAFVHNSTFANFDPTTADLQEYLQTKQLSVGVDVINGRQQVYYIYNDTNVFVTDQPVNHTDPSASGQNIVWLEEIAGARHVIKYDVLTRQKTRLTFMGTHQNPKIDGNNIIWESWLNEKWQVMLYDGQEVRQISSGQSSIRSQISGDKVVYVQQLQPNVWRVYQYTISTAQLEMIDQGSAEISWPYFVDGELRLRPVIETVTSEEDS